MQGLLDCLKKPWIMQGGMGLRISLSGLTSAVSNEGGIGVISAAGAGLQEKDFSKNFYSTNIQALREEIRKAKELTDGIFGVNIMFALSNFIDLVVAAVEEEAPIIFVGAGISRDVAKYLAGSKTKLGIIVSSARVIRTICKISLPDIIVVEGPRAGGHLGFSKQDLSNPSFALENLMKEVLQEVKNFADKKFIPVFAAGGIYTGAHIKKFLDLGADGVQMATRFVTTNECDAHRNFKEAYLNATKDDIVIIESPVGMPGRAIRNKFLDEVFQGKWKTKGCAYRCLKTCDGINSPYCIMRALVNAADGNLKQGFAFAGSNAFLAEKIISVKELMATLREEYAVSCK